MICKEYQELLPREKSSYVGELLHSCMSDSELYEIGMRIIRLAKNKGVFEGVTINPEPIPDTHITD
jgi:hypothetical protein